MDFQHNNYCLLKLVVLGQNVVQKGAVLSGAVSSERSRVLWSRLTEALAFSYLELVYCSMSSSNCCFLTLIFNITVIQVYALTSNAEEAVFE